MRFSSQTAISAAVAGLAAGAVGAAVAAPGDPLVNACVGGADAKYQVRVPPSGACDAGEEARSWSVAGPAGAPGPAGVPGTPGPAGPRGSGTGPTMYVRGDHNVPLRPERRTLVLSLDGLPSGTYTAMVSGEVAGFINRDFRHRASGGVDCVAEAFNSRRRRTIASQRLHYISRASSDRVPLRLPPNSATLSGPVSIRLICEEHLGRFTYDSVRLEDLRVVVLRSD